MKKSYTGINIQWPISQLILSGEKTIETRTYPIPKQYIRKPMALIETPGKNGKFKARIVGLITFGESFEYADQKSFYRDSHLHYVEIESIWRWTDDRKKWGWPVINIIRFEKESPAPKKKGIKYTKGITLTVAY